MRKISTFSIIAYALPAFPLAALSLPVYIFLPTFYAQTLGLGLATTGLILLIARLWDVISDPVVGVLSDMTKTPWGRRKPWIISWMPMVCLSSWFLLVPLPGADAAYLLLWSILLYTGWTGMILPLNAWGAELSSDYHERTRIAGWREALTVAGILFALGTIAYLGFAAGGNEGDALRTIALIMVIVTPIATILMAMGVREPKYIEKGRVGFREALPVLKHNAPFRKLITAYLINGIANGLPATLFLLFVEFGLGMKDKSGELLFIYFLCGVLSVPFWLVLSKKFGKHLVWCGAMIWACVFFGLVPFVGESDYTLFLAVCILTGFSLGADLVLPAAMQADVVDLDTLETGQQRTGLYFSLWGVATKLSLALAAGIAFPLLDLGGFSAETGGAVWQLVALYAVVPIIFKIIAIKMMWSYPVTEEAVSQNHLKIMEKWG